MKCVKILGASPAGLSAAINLSQNGYNVDIFERNLDVGSNIKGNLQ
jgi:flavin-dependent dehydrogenase